MKYLRILLFAILTIVAQGQDGFDLSDALGGSDPVTAKPKPKPPKDTGTGDFNLGDVFDMPGPTKPPVTPKPKKPSGDEFDLGDALGGPDPHPTKQPAVPPKNPGKGGSFDNDDLGYVAGEGDYNPDKGKSGGRSGGRAEGDTQGGSDQPQAEGSGKIAGIVSAVGVALLGAASSYFAYQKKKLCFKISGGDPESGNKTQSGTQSEPQILSNLLRSS
ncbi:CD99 antigen-like isoform X1 [Lepisosteus oculatus]|uniref:CD99 molecule (Xg blood group) n=1 Tax=Lepisosteus oculatus TaxID=7918 RepID=W5MVY3_LEPOC|nr:PREDICTED: CD99 antigen-like isoform X1 [Lepisosteus oculatus]